MNTPRRPPPHRHTTPGACRWCRRWTVAHERRLRALVGEQPLAQIAAQLTAEFGIPRTETAVIVRCKRLSLSPTLVHHNARAVGALFGVYSKTVSETWIGRGWLQGTQQHPGQAGSSWIITDAALEAFIRDYPHVYDLHLMRPGKWRSLAELVWRRDPLLTVEEAAPVVGLAPKTLARFLREGRLVGERRYRKPGPWAGQWLIRRSTLVAFRPPDRADGAGFTVITRTEAQALVAQWGSARGHAANAARRRQQGAA